MRQRRLRLGYSVESAETKRRKQRIKLKNTKRKNETKAANKRGLQIQFKCGRNPNGGGAKEGGHAAT